jgi:hypothetical protein
MMMTKLVYNMLIILIAIDSTIGVKVTNRGEWIRHKWNVKRGYLKIHVAV